MRPLLYSLVIASIELFHPPALLAQSLKDSFRQRFNLSQDPDALLERILSAREFQEIPGRSLFESVVEWVKHLASTIVDWILSGLQHFDTVEGEGDTLAMILAGIMIAVVAILLVLAVIRLYSFLIGRMRRERPHVPQARPEIGEVSNSGAARNQAFKAAEAGNYRSALVLLFHFALFWLAEEGRLSLHPGKTNREILESLDTGEPSRDCLTEMVPVFNRVRYGKAPCGRDDYERFLALCSRVTERT